MNSEVWLEFLFLYERSSDRDHPPSCEILPIGLTLSALSGIIASVSSMKFRFLFGFRNHAFPIHVHRQSSPHRSRKERSFGVIAIALHDGRRCIEETLDCIHTDFPIYSPSSNAPSMVGFLFAVSEYKIQLKFDFVGCALRTTFKASTEIFHH